VNKFFLGAKVVSEVDDGVKGSEKSLKRNGLVNHSCGATKLRGCLKSVDAR